MNDLAQGWFFFFFFYRKAKSEITAKSKAVKYEKYYLEESIRTQHQQDLPFLF